MYEFECDEDKLQAFNDSAIVTKEGLISDIKWALIRLETPGDKNDFKGHTATFRQLYIDLYKRFLAEVEKRRFFETLEDWWCYTYEVDDSGIVLKIQYCDSVHFDDDKYIDFIFVGEEYDLFKVNTRMLTVDEYAKTYDVSVGTVRQWIRRGKLRSAIKAGKEWRIPELSEITGRGYKRGFYEWDAELDDIPGGFEFLQGMNEVSISQDTDDKNLFDIEVSDKEGKKKHFTMETKEREKFELYLISNPFVKTRNEHFENRG